MQSATQAGAASLAHPALRAMFEARKRVFVDLLKWDVPVLADRYEVDQFDTPDAEYLVLVDAAERHRASARLLRTDRDHILGILYPVLCEGEVPRGRTIREITRFCLEPTLCARERRLARNQLVTALTTHALSSGISDYTGVAGIAWFKQIMSFGWTCQPLGPARALSGSELVALHIQIDAATPTALAMTGIYTPVTGRYATWAGLQ